MMKLLLESWKSYLFEQEEEEEKGLPQQPSNYPEEEEDVYDQEQEIEIPPDVKHFGFDLKKLGEKLTNASWGYEAARNDDIQEFDENNPRIIKLSQNVRNYDEWEFIVEYINDPDLQFLGEGSFRMTFSYGDDYVIKVAKQEYDIEQAIQMNREDEMLGKLPKYSNLFPKVYEVSKTNLWIIMEKCFVINKRSDFLRYFPNPTIYEELVNDYAKTTLFNLVLDYSVQKIKKDQFNLEDCVIYIENFILTQGLDSKGITLQTIVKTYEDIPLFNQIANFCAEFGVAPREIRRGNTGISSEGKFVIIDSSIAETIG